MEQHKKAQAKDGGLKHPQKDNFVDFAHGDVLIQAGENQYDAETVVGITANGEYVFDDVVNMTPTGFQRKEELSPTAAGRNAESDIQESPSERSISQNAPSVKQKYSFGGESYSIVNTQDMPWEEQVGISAMMGQSRAAILEKLGDDATVFVKNENKLDQMLPGNQILKSLALRAKVELDGTSVAQSKSSVKLKYSMEDSGAES